MMTLSLSNSFIMTKKEKKRKKKEKKRRKKKKEEEIGHFRILFYCLDSLICCSFPFLFMLNVSLLLGIADAEILRFPLLETQS